MTENGGLTHFDSQGQAHMVDVGEKSITHRSATAQGVIRMQPETFQVIASGSAKKGDVIGIARIAAIMASKKPPNSFRSATRCRLRMSALSSICIRKPPALSAV